MAGHESTSRVDDFRGMARNVIRLLEHAYEHWRAERTMRLGAGIAYYTLFAAVPILSLAAALVARLVSAEQSKEFLVEALDGLVGDQAVTIADTVLDAISSASTGLGWFGFITVLVSASFLFLALQDALNVIWQAPVVVGLRQSIKRRLIAFAVALGVAFYFVSSFVIQAVVGLAERLVPGDLAIIESLAEVVTALGSWAVGVLAIALLFKVLPYAEVAWRDAIIGGLITAVFVVIGTSLIAAYVSRFGSSSLTGAASSVALFLVWVYYQAQIVLAGAVLTKILGDTATNAR